MPDALLLLIRWLHAIAAVAWVGGGIFYWVVVRPAVRANIAPPALARFAGAEFGQLVGMAMWTLAITGGILAVSRLSEPTSTAAYGAVLGVKIALSVWMFFLVVGRRGRADAGAPRGRLRMAANALGHVQMTLVLGLAIFLLSDVLRLLVERGLG
jgi:putative copper export protein